MNTKTKEGARNKGNPYFLRVPWNKGGLVNTGPGSWDRKLGEGYKDTLDQSDWCLMFLCNQAWISLLRLPEPWSNRKTVLKVKCFSEASFKGSKGAIVSWCKTREGFQEGMPLMPLGLSLWKLSRRWARFSSLLTLMGTLPNLSAMADLYPSMVPGFNFLS